MLVVQGQKNESFRIGKVDQLVVCRIPDQSQTRDGATNCVGAFHVLHNQAFAEHQQNELKRLNISLAFESWRGGGRIHRKWTAEKPVHFFSKIIPSEV